jgi:EcsC protein family
MAAQIKTARAKSRTPARVRLTAYESDQVAQIAAWKSRPPSPLGEIIDRITLPGAKLVEKVIPDAAVRVAIEQSFRLAALLAGKEEIKRRGGVDDLSDLRNKKLLEDCDRLALQTGVFSQVFATVEGAVTGAGGALTTLIDVPLLFVLSLWTIFKIGHCYGYPLDQRQDRHFVLGLLVAALSGIPEMRKQRLDELHELEDLLIGETQQEVLAEEIMSVLFQLEIFGEIPGFGAISGALLNLSFMRRIENTARRVFQERWLKDTGKVRSIEPATAGGRILAAGWVGTMRRMAYAGCYCAGFGVALPASVLQSLIVRSS